jgi:hypothetical protein
MIIGVDFCHIQDKEHPFDHGGTELSHMYVPINTGMAGVVPAWRLHDLIMSDKALKQRRGAEEATLKRLAAATTEAPLRLPPEADGKDSQSSV